MTIEERIARYLEQVRAKYTQAQVDALGKQGKALLDDDGEHYSYPIDDKDDLSNAIQTVGLGGADHDKIRAWIIKRAGEMGLSSEIPDSWNADGSLKKESKSLSPRRAKRRHRSGLPLGREYRRVSARDLEVRESTVDNAIVVQGAFVQYGAPYDVCDMFGSFRETMHPGVLANVLAARPDVRFLFNHDGMPHARTANGTMQLTDTPTSGLVSATFDSRRADSVDLAYAIERGDITQMSWGFTVDRDEWSGEDDWGLPNVRDVYGIQEIFDVSAVTYPASPTTSIELAYRSLTAMPVESRARIRRLYGVARELRAGKVLSAENAKALQDALVALHEADDVDIHQIVEHLQTIDKALDAGQAGLAAVLHKANPDDDDSADQDADGDAGAPDGTAGASSDPASVDDGTGSRSLDYLKLEAEQLRLRGRRARD